MKDFFKELFEYTHHCNIALINAFHDHSGKLPEKPVQLLNHILSVHHIWNSRIITAHSQFRPWDIHSPNTYTDIDNDNFDSSVRIIDSFDLDTSIRYANFKGQPFENTVRDILFQIINHSTYHRGQIAMEFRNSNIEPLLTEYIFYKR
jgi:uncharacterized damage-inducible protein DinB